MARTLPVMHGADWLRTQLTSFGCAACGQPFVSGTMRVLAEREGLFFVDLACPRCGSQAMAIVTVQMDAGAELRADAGELVSLSSGSLAVDRDIDPGPDRGAPVSADDVLDFHQALAAFQGDAYALLDRLDALERSAAR
jgi:DNA-directed RNA polymerase subunit RPC12/RpoP